MVKRYDVDREYIGDGEYIGAMVEVKDGDYVTYEDHEQIVQDLMDRIKDLELQVEVEMYRD